MADFIHCKSKLYVWCTLQQFILNYGWVESSCSSIKYNVLVWVLKAKYDFLIGWKWIFADMSRGNSNLPLFFLLFFFYRLSHYRTSSLHQWECSQMLLLSVGLFTRSCSFYKPGLHHHDGKIFHCQMVVSDHMLRFKLWWDRVKRP